MYVLLIQKCWNCQVVVHSPTSIPPCVIQKWPAATAQIGKQKEKERAHEGLRTAAWPTHHHRRTNLDLVTLACLLAVVVACSAPHPVHQLWSCARRRTPYLRSTTRSRYHRTPHIEEDGSISGRGRGGRAHREVRNERWEVAAVGVEKEEEGIRLWFGRCYVFIGIWSVELNRSFVISGPCCDPPLKSEF